MLPDWAPIAWDALEREPALCDALTAFAEALAFSVEHPTAAELLLVTVIEGIGASMTGTRKAMENVRAAPGHRPASGPGRRDRPRGLRTPLADRPPRRPARPGGRARLRGRLRLPHRPCGSLHTGRTQRAVRHCARRADPCADQPAGARRCVTRVLGTTHVTGRSARHRASRSSSFNLQDTSPHAPKPTETLVSIEVMDDSGAPHGCSHRIPDCPGSRSGSAVLARSAWQASH